MRGALIRFCEEHLRRSNPEPEDGSPRSRWSLAKAIYILVVALSLLPSFTHAEERLACEMRMDKVLDQAEKANQCRDVNDCDFVNLKTCRGCAPLPIHSAMKQRMQIVVDTYYNSCESSCQDSCPKPVMAKCVNGKCDFGLRDWKYLTRNPKSVRGE